MFSVNALGIDGAIRDTQPVVYSVRAPVRAIENGMGILLDAKREQLIDGMGGIIRRMTRLSPRGDLVLADFDERELAIRLLSYIEGRDTEIGDGYKQGDDRKPSITPPLVAVSSAVRHEEMRGIGDPPPNQ